MNHATYNLFKYEKKIKQIERKKKRNDKQKALLLFWNDEDSKPISNKWIFKSYKYSKCLFERKKITLFNAYQLLDNSWVFDYNDYISGWYKKADTVLDKILNKSY